MLFIAGGGFGDGGLPFAFFYFFEKNKKKREKALDTFFFLLYDNGIHGEETCRAAKKNGYAAPSATQPLLCD